MNTTTLALIGGKSNARLQCTTCKHMVPTYVDRGDGKLLRKNDNGQPDPTLDSGPCVFAYEVLDDTCPNCGTRDHDLWPGRGFKHVNIKATTGINACDAFCATATGMTCKCSCNGTNHGTR